MVSLDRLAPMIFNDRRVFGILENLEDHEINRWKFKIHSLVLNGFTSPWV